MYTIEDADAYKAILSDPNGLWAKNPQKQAQALADHNARVETLIAEGKLAPSPEVSPQANQAALWSDRVAERREFASGALAELHPGMVELMTARAVKLEGATSEQLTSLADKAIRELSFTSEYADNQRRMVDGQLKNVDPRSYFDRLVAEADTYLKANPTVKITLAQAKADLPTLRALATASRARK